MSKKAWNKKTHEQYLQQLKDKNIKVIPLEKYIDDSTKILHRCECGNEWMVKPNHILRGVKCKDCGKIKLFSQRTKTHEQYVNELEELNYGIEVIDKYITSDTKIAHKCPMCKREDWMIEPSAILSGKRFMCPDCSIQYHESKHATVLKQIYKKYYPNVVWEDKSCINPINRRIMPTDIVDYDNKISIEIQSEFHDNEYAFIKDNIKKDYWKQRGFKHCSLDIRDYTILEMVQVFFPKIEEIPNWVTVLKPITKKLWNIDEAQLLLNEGYSMQHVGLTLGISPSCIRKAVKNGELIKPKNYKIHRNNNATKRMRYILQYSLDGKFIKEYHGYKELVEMGYNSTSIRNACVGVFVNNPHKFKDYLWFYKEDGFTNNKVPNKIISKKYKNIVQLDLLGNFIREYKSQEGLEKINMFNYENVQKSCRGYIEPKIKNTNLYNPHKYKKYLWYYADDYYKNIGKDADMYEQKDIS